MKQKLSFLVFDHIGGVILVTDSWNKVREKIEQYSQFGLCRFEIITTSN
jgi:hypothetical protein